MMTLHLELPAEVEARLTAEAQQHNLSLEDYALSKLLAQPAPEVAREQTAGEAILRLARETFGTLPPDEWAKMPADFAINHDHYIHSAPKVQEGTLFLPIPPIGLHSIRLRTDCTP